MKNRRRTVKVGGVLHTEGKVVLIGGSKAVTLPKAWADEHNIKLGDIVIKVANSMLIISQKPEPIKER